MEDRINTALSLCTRKLAEVIVDTNNNLTSVTDAATHTTSYRMDDKGRVYQTISPDTGTITYQYDPAGNLTSKTDAKGVTISYVYDALNRLTKIDYPTNVDTVYSYDSCLNGKGRVCSMTDASGTTVYEYTAKGQVKKKTTTIDGVQQVTQYAYDMNGNLKSITEPTGEVTTYNYSNDKAVSVLKGAANLATSINYKPFGGVSSLAYGNGVAGSISYDNQYRVTGITAGSALSLSYPTYDANGNIMTINNALDPTKNKTFGYDALDRLTSAAASGLWGSLAWAYDGVGNRQTENSTVYSYTPGTNKLTGAGSTTFGFDNNGNTTTQGARQYTYNENQRLVQVVDGSMTATYTYNGLDQRVKKVVNGVTTIFNYDERGQLIAESNGTGAITAVYVYLNGQPLAKIEGTSVYYYHNDALGTPQKMTDSTGTVVWSADYKPFGEATIIVSTITNNLRFPGQYYDAETGLLYNLNRDYNQVIGRYIEADPIGLHGGLNLYRYPNNPITHADPKGLQACTSLGCFPTSLWRETGFEFLPGARPTLWMWNRSGPTRPLTSPSGAAATPLTFTLTCYWKKQANVHYERDVYCLVMCTDCYGGTSISGYSSTQTKDEIHYKDAGTTSRSLDVFFNALAYVLDDQYCTGFMAP